MKNGRLYREIRIPLGQWTEYDTLSALGRYLYCGLPAQPERVDFDTFREATLSEPIYSPSWWSRVWKDPSDDPWEEDFADPDGDSYLLGLGVRPEVY